MTPSAGQIVKTCGGQKAWKARVRTTGDVVKELRAGLPYAVLGAIARDFQLDLKDLVEVLDIPWSTLGRRKRAGRFHPDESDRVYRLARIAAMAAEVLQGKERAARWLREPNRALGDQVPLRLLDTEVGARQVEAILGRIEHGVWS